MSWFAFPNLSKVVICACEPAWSTCLHKAHSIMKTQEPQWGGERLWTSSPLENVSHGGAHRYFGRGREDRCSWSWKLRAGSPVFTLDKGEKKEDIFLELQGVWNNLYITCIPPQVITYQLFGGKVGSDKVDDDAGDQTTVHRSHFHPRTLHCVTTKQVLQNYDNGFVRTLCCYVTFFSSLGE